MAKIYIFGHKKPDTDSVTSAISLAYLKRKQGFDAEAKVLGRLNNETKFALNYFNVEYPEYLNDVKTQIKDICPILIKGSIEEAMEAENVHTAV